MALQMMIILDSDKQVNEDFRKLFKPLFQPASTVLILFFTQ